MNSNDLLKSILEDKPPLPPEDERLHQAIRRVFSGQRNKAIAQMTLASLFALCLLVWGMSVLRHASEQRDMLLGVVLVMVGLELNVLMKLWYWVVDNKISVLKEQKKTQLMIAQLTRSHEGETAPATAVASLETYKEPGISLWERLDPAAAKRISRAVIMAGVLAAILVAIS